MSETKEKMDIQGIANIEFDKDDKLKLKDFGEKLFNIIDSHKNVSRFNEGFSISLNAKFGNGKTTFLHMFKNFMIKEKNYEVIFIDAWRSDFTSRPIVAILFELINHLSNFQKKYKKNEKLWEVGDKILSILKLALNQLVKSKTDGFIDLQVMHESYKKTGKEEKDFIFQTLKAEKESINAIRDVISEYTKNKKLLIIVDELDRARPDYAVKFLEDMKHFFDIKGVTFLFGVNKEQLKSTVQHLYGNLKFEGYYRKFFQHDIDMPDIYRSAQNFVDTLLKTAGVSYDETSYPDVRKKTVEITSRIFELSLRDVECMMQILSRVITRVGYPFTLLADCYVFFSCMYIKDKRMFNEIADGKIDLNQFFKYLFEDIKLNDKIQPRSSEMYHLATVSYISIVSNTIVNPSGSEEQVVEQIQQKFNQNLSSLISLKHDFLRNNNNNNLCKIIRNKN